MADDGMLHRVCVCERTYMVVSVHTLRNHATVKFIANDLFNEGLLTASTMPC